MERTISRARIVSLAREWIGTPYHHQGHKKGIGTDCVGLIRGIYEELYGILPEAPSYSPDWGDSNGNEDLLMAAYRYLIPKGRHTEQPGDVLAVSWLNKSVAKHAMLMTYDGRAIHAKNHCRVSEIYLDNWWRRKVVMVFEFPGVLD